MDKHNETVAKITVVKNGPLVVNGGIPLEGVSGVKASETYYLCRCGKSAKKPFCDGAHSRIKFNDEE